MSRDDTPPTMLSVQLRRRPEIHVDAAAFVIEVDAVLNPHHNPDGIDEEVWKLLTTSMTTDEAARLKGEYGYRWGIKVLDGLQVVYSAPFMEWHSKADTAAFWPFFRRYRAALVSPIARLNFAPHVLEKPWVYAGLIPRLA